VAGIFPNRAALMRHVGMVLAEQDDEWQDGRRLFRPETMAAIDAVIEHEDVSPALLMVRTLTQQARGLDQLPGGLVWDPPVTDAAMVSLLAQGFDVSKQAMEYRPINLELLVDQRISVQLTSR